MSRTKDQWIEMTGGFPLGETHEQRLARQTEIQKLRDKQKAGKYTAEDDARMGVLLGRTDDDEFE